VKSEEDEGRWKKWRYHSRREW